MSSRSHTQSVGALPAAGTSPMKYSKGFEPAPSSSRNGLPQINSGSGMLRGAPADHWTKPTSINHRSGLLTQAGKTMFGQ